MAISLPHALLVPYPSQGHVIPFLELAYCLTDRGFKITFVNTEFIHKRLIASMSSRDSVIDRIRFVPVRSELITDDDHEPNAMIFEVQRRVTPIYIEELIRESRKSPDDKITCIIADGFMAMSLSVGKKMGLRTAAFWTSPARVLTTLLNIPKLVDVGFIDANGIPKEQQLLKLNSGLPAISTAHLMWTTCGDHKTRQRVFDHIVKNNPDIQMAEFIICNSFYDIELPVFTYSPNLLPIGPLLTGQRFGKPVGHLWAEDSTCIDWLDKQPPNSVIYIAFGSFTIFDQQQFQELAYGLAQTTSRFLWVVRPDLLAEGLSSYFPSDFLDKVAARGKLVTWSPQPKVLAHPSIACFLSHCGWNSTMEGVMNAVPFLCWPYFADQFHNQDYICDSWKIGLKLNRDDNGLITREEIRIKIEELLDNQGIKKRARAFKKSAERTIQEGGASYENFSKFVEAMKE